MTNHAPTPWTANNGTITDADGLRVCQMDDHIPADQEAAEAAGIDHFKGNAARSVQCVNACAGIEDPAATLAKVKAAMLAMMGYLNTYCREDSRDGEPAEMTSEAQYQHNRLAAALRALNGEG